jgi:flagellar motor switch protein FliM
MAVMTKSITLPSALGNWYEYNPRISIKQKVDEETSAAFSALEAVHLDFGEKLCMLLAGELKLASVLMGAKIYRMTYGEFIDQNMRSISVAQINGHFQGTESQGSVSLLCDYSLALGLVDRMVGGNGHLVRRSDAMTQIEKGCFKVFSEKVVKAMNQIYTQPVMNLNLNEILGPQLQPISEIANSADYYVVAVELMIGEEQPVKILMTYDQISVEALQMLYQKVIRKTKKNKLRLDPVMVKSAMVPVTVELGKGTLSLQEAMTLQIGDLIVLDQKVDQPIRVQIGDHALMLAQPGQIGSNLSIKMSGYQEAQLSLPPVDLEPIAEPRIAEDLREDEMQLDLEGHKDLTQEVDHDFELEETEEGVEEETDQETRSALQEKTEEDSIWNDDDPDFSWDEDLK